MGVVFYQGRCPWLFSRAPSGRPLERKYDEKFRVVFDAMRQLMAPPPADKKRRIGF